MAEEGQQIRGINWRDPEACVRALGAEDVQRRMRQAIKAPLRVAGHPHSPPIRSLSGRAGSDRGTAPSSE